MPGILGRMACGVALALAIGGVSCAADPPEAQKRLFFEECSMCIKHRKYRQKWPLPKKAKHHEEIAFFFG